MNILKRNRGCRVVFGQYIVAFEVCDEQFEKKSGLKGCVWSIHCCLVKYVMNSLKRNLV